MFLEKNYFTWQRNNENCTEFFIRHYLPTYLYYARVVDARIVIGSDCPRGQSQRQPGLGLYVI